MAILYGITRLKRNPAILCADVSYVYAVTGLLLFLGSLKIHFIHAIMQKLLFYNLNGSTEYNIKTNAIEFNFCKHI